MFEIDFLQDFYNDQVACLYYFIDGIYRIYILSEVEKATLLYWQQQKKFLFSGEVMKFFLAWPNTFT